MNRYQIINQIGDGAYGIVMLAIHLETKGKVAIKRIKRKFYSWSDCLSLREVKVLRTLNHRNIIKLKEVIRENNILYFVFEHMHANLYQIISDRKTKFSEQNVRSIAHQLFLALDFMHKNGVFHRDIKPENLLCHNGIQSIKIADFGLAREIRSKPPYTEYVSTRWYRSPEILLRSVNYTAAIDMWAAACVIFEVYTLRPLFPGHNEIDMIYKICGLLGTPFQFTWAEGIKLSKMMHFRWPSLSKTPFIQVMPNASGDLISFLNALIVWNPDMRLSAHQTLKHKFLRNSVKSPKIKAIISNILPTSPVQISPTKIPIKESKNSKSNSPSLDQTNEKNYEKFKPNIAKEIKIKYVPLPSNIIRAKHVLAGLPRHTMDNQFINKNKEGMHVTNKMNDCTGRNWYKKYLK